jgi:hypothetical protein
MKMGLTSVGLTAIMKSSSDQASLPAIIGSVTEVFNLWLLISFFHAKSDIGSLFDGTRPVKVRPDCSGSFYRDSG